MHARKRKRKKNEIDACKKRKEKINQRMSVKKRGKNENNRKNKHTTFATSLYHYVTPIEVNKNTLQ